RVNPPTDDIPAPRKRADFPRVFRHERASANRPGETSRDVGGSNACWCGSRAYARLAFHRMEEGLAYGPSAPGAYREGRRGWQMEQGQGPDLSADALVRWPGPGHLTSCQ